MTSAEGTGTGRPLIVGFGGSTGADSVTTALLQACLDETERLGARTQLIDAPELAALPIYGSEAAVSPEAIMGFVDAVRRADAVVIATPGYHGGMSGLVKNALDHLEMLRDDPRPYLDGRAAGVIVSAAGWQAAGTALVAVRSAIHALRGWPTPLGVTVNSTEQRRDADGRFPERVRSALGILAHQLTDFAHWRAAAR